MIGSRCSTVSELAVTIRPPFEPRANAVDGALDLAGVVHVDRASTPRRRTAPRTGWRAHWPVPEGMAGSRRTAARVTPGAISLSSSSHFALRLYSNDSEAGDIAAGPRQALDEARADRIGGLGEHDRHGAGGPSQWSHGRAARRQNDVRRERDQFGRVSAICGRHRPAGPTGIDLHVAADGPAQLLQPLQERPRCGPVLQDRPRLRAYEYADAPHPLRLLRARRQRPRAAAPPSSVMNSRRLIIRSPRRRGRAASAARRGRAPWRS